MSETIRTRFKQAADSDSDVAIQLLHPETFNAKNKEWKTWFYLHEDWARDVYGEELYKALKDNPEGVIANVTIEIEE